MRSERVCEGTVRLRCRLVCDDEHWEFLSPLTPYMHVALDQGIGRVIRCRVDSTVYVNDHQHVSYPFSFVLWPRELY